MGKSAWLIHDGGWFKVILTFYTNQGLGFLYLPNSNQFGVAFLLWSLVICWDDREEYQYGEA
jgi:hypothetical protein